MSRMSDDEFFLTIYTLTKIINSLANLNTIYFNLEIIRKILNSLLKCLKTRKSNKSS